MAICSDASAYREGMRDLATYLEDVRVNRDDLLPSQSEQRHAVGHLPPHSHELHQPPPRLLEPSLQLSLPQSIQILVRPYPSFLCVLLEQHGGLHYEPRAVAAAQGAEKGVGGGRGECGRARKGVEGERGWRGADERERGRREERGGREERGRGEGPGVRHWRAEGFTDRVDHACYARYVVVGRADKTTALV